ncbi:hypothetical protein G7Y89_g1346 [Cudoniella acicularis]|uniref:N-acetyltransferase domain-containing protein n=1 Tax=Cudoniella acicularis TaxID=354080 RepID=A0A8H4RWJ9_9HELO|nr:hypothetical protein G7Y89_g1346 [Cudoniella acicularis]
MNRGGWSTQRLSFFVGLLGNVFAFVSADGAFHMSEEIHNPSLVVPRSILLSIFLNGIMELAMVIAVLFCMGDVSAALATNTGYPFMEIFLQATNSVSGSAVLASIITVLCLCATVGVLASTSRMFWSFARDRGLLGWGAYNRRHLGLGNKFNRSYRLTWLGKHKGSSINMGTVAIKKNYPHIWKNTLLSLVFTTPWPILDLMKEDGQRDEPRANREDAIDEAATWLKLWHTQNPSSYWQKVVDTETGKIAGGALWNINKENPIATQNTSEVIWFPSDSSRTFIEQALQAHSAPRARAGQRAHLFFTHPDYRRKGVGQQFMDWGMKKADELGYEFFFESTPYGRLLYEANGFVYIEEYVNHPQTDAPDEK